MHGPAPRRAGVLVPLFSLRSARGWGIGEIGDIEAMARWLDSAGLSVLQLLPINELPLHETSPYSSLSAMAIDPQYLSLDAVEDFAAIGGERGLDAELRARLESLRAGHVVDYPGVRRLKHIAARRAFNRFRDVELRTDSGRAQAFREFTVEQEWWLDDYALYRALHERFGGRAWTDWPEPLRRREPAALDAARRDLADEVRYRQYLQWLADGQWQAARAAAGRVTLFGDLPFMVARDSADVWSRQDDFQLDASLGVPPDAFSETGQDWQLPVYRWDVIAAHGFEWLRQRARRNAALFSGYRIDHLVGFYRTFCRPIDGPPGGPGQFTPADQPDQAALGEQVLRVFAEAGAELIAEDLGVVPDFVRASMASLDLPGCKVFRWERRWDEEEQPFVDPLTYPVRSMATSGTHDTEPMVTWWEAASADERAAVLAIPLVAQRLGPDAAQAALNPVLEPAVRDALLEVLFASSAYLMLLPIQDVFGWADRINTPATINDENWTWRLPWPGERLMFEPEAVAASRKLRAWSERYGRLLA